MIKVDLKRHRREVIGAVIVLLLLLGGVSVFKYTTFNPGFETVSYTHLDVYKRQILYCRAFSGFNLLFPVSP